MTGIRTIEVLDANTASGSYETPGNSNTADSFIIGDDVDIAKFPSNTLDSAFTVS